MDKAANHNDLLHGYYFEDLREGMNDVYGKTVTDADIVMFAGISGDINPVHLNHEFASATMFEGRIAHGILTVSQTLRFKAPVKSGDTVTAIATVTKLVPEKKFVELKTQCLVRGKVVLDGEATVMVPSRP